jgi:hypothetical protein
MRNLRILIPSIALAALTATGCFLISGQIVVSANLGDLHAVNGLSSVGMYVDLSAESSDYKDHKDKLKDIVDIAVLGTFKNNLAVPVSGEVWIVPSPSGIGLLADQTAVIAAGGIKLWSMALGASETRKVDWDASAALFTPAGKTTLKNEIKGDGAFTLYLFGSTATYDIQVTKAVVVAVISANP